MGGFQRTGDLDAEQTHEVLQRVQGLFSRHGEEFSGADAKEIASGAPSIPQFPMFITMASAVKDMLDSLDFTGIGVLVTSLLTLLCSCIVTFWLLERMEKPQMKKRTLKRVLRRGALAFGIEILPFLKLVPMSTIFVVMTHFHEVKVAKLLNRAHRMLRSAGN